jgi:hypothetical protein
MIFLPTLNLDQGFDAVYMFFLSSTYEVRGGGYLTLCSLPYPSWMVVQENSKKTIYKLNLTMLLIM